MSKNDLKFRVVVAYRFKKKRGGVAIGDTVEAPTVDLAEEIAEARHVTPYPARVLAYITTERLP